MGYSVDGFADIHTILSNERKVGGAIEAKRIRLRTGEEFTNPVITNIDFSGSTFYSVSFVTDQGESYVVNVQDISMMQSLTHCRVHEMKNTYYRPIKTEQRIRYLKKLCEINEGSYTKIFREEAAALIKDIGKEALRSTPIAAHIDYTENNVIQIA
ncbi:hypothetical protein [Bacillus sp. FJAT-44742]|uniref:hypothetical protein n=1 Tax=Bacillus sp. FJAT-44742 TaxID=2014005 RepID=UPI000C2346EA|nr:hypothetical protein [Bacillus sp. FJAT-44742]